MTMPLKVYGHECPYCSKKDTISFVGKGGKYIDPGKRDQICGARCMNCGKEFAINWEIIDKEEVYSFSDLDYFIDNFMNLYGGHWKRDIDGFLLTEF